MIIIYDIKRLAAKATMAATVPMPLTGNGQICSFKKPMESHRSSAWPCSWAPSEGKRIHGCKSSWHPSFQRIKRSTRSLTYWRNFMSRRPWWLMNASSFTVVINRWASKWQSTLQNSDSWPSIVSSVRIWMMHSEIVLCVACEAKRLRKREMDLTF